MDTTTDSLNHITINTDYPITAINENALAAMLGWIPEPDDRRGYDPQTDTHWCKFMRGKNLDTWVWQEYPVWIRAERKLDKDGFYCFMNHKRYPSLECALNDTEGEKFGKFQENKQ